MMTPIEPIEKTFDWAHYQAVAQGGIQAAYQDEFNFLPTVRVLKSLYAREPWVNFCLNAISRQFMRPRFVINLKTSSDGDEQTITQHPLLTFLNYAGKENSSFFTSNNMIDMTCTGNAYVWVSPDLKDKKRLPSERVDIRFENGSIKNYQITNTQGDVSIDGSSGTVMQLSPDEIIHFKMPNPYSSFVGMSMLIAINLPVLIDKYGREFVVGFFLRGGHTSGIIQTDATNADQLTRFVRSIMQAVGGRRNAHADKILPKGATWAGGSAKFSDMQLTELIKDNQTLFRAATGVTNTVLGIAENVNRATAMAEMEQFWKMTILPLQEMYTAAIESSSIWKRFGLDERYNLRFDNSHIEYLDDFERKLESDGKLKPVATVNERRERLGYERMESLGDKFEVEMTPPPATGPLGFAFPQSLLEAKSTEVDPMIEIKTELPKYQDPTNRVESYFQREFARWEDIMLANIDDPSKGEKIIEDRSEKFADGFSELMLEPMMKIYEFNIKRIRGQKSTAQKDDRETQLAALKERGKRVLKGLAFENGKKSFEGYSVNNMKRVHETIETELGKGKNADDVAVAVRKKFGEFYEGQAKTIVRTEFASATAQASYQFGNDLATITKKLRKTWVTMDDKDTRDDHKDLDNHDLVGNAADVPDMYFQLDGSDYLRFPKDETGDAKAVVNCRCDLIWSVEEWGS